MFKVSEIIDLREKEKEETLELIKESLNSLESGDILEIIINSQSIARLVEQELATAEEYKVYEPETIGYNIHIYVKIF